MRLIRRSLLLCLTLLLAISAFGQDDEDSLLDDNAAAAPAMLSLDFDRQGDVNASLTLPPSATDFDTVRDLLARSLHCPVGALKHPDGFSYALPSFQQNWSVGQARALPQANGRLQPPYAQRILRRRAVQAPATVGGRFRF